MIYILNKQETIIDILEPEKERYYYNDLHVQDLKEGSETFEFSTNTDIPKNSTIVLRTNGGELKTFIVQSMRDLRNDYQEKTYYCDGEFLELRYTRILEPQILSGQTAETALNFGLQGTRWSLGVADKQIVRDVEIGEYMNVLKYIRLVASEFDLEMRFRVEFSANSISKRYVDMVPRAGLDMGKEIIFGKDLQSIERIEDTSGVVTALYGIGPADEKGRYMSIESVNGGKKYVEDLNALQRWGKDGEHRFDIFTPDIDQKYLTPQMLLDLTKKELKRRINSVVTYKIDAVDLYDALGFDQSEVVNIGDTVRPKDIYYSPPLYVEARVIRTERSNTDPSRNKYALGDYVDIDINNYNSIRQVNSVLNNKKETWNDVVNRVHKDDFTNERIIEIINDPEATAQIIAKKLQIIGAVEVLSELSKDLGTITAGKISGASFETSSETGWIEMKDGYIRSSNNSSDFILIDENGIGIGTGYGTRYAYVFLKLTKSGISNPDGGAVQIPDSLDVANSLYVGGLGSINGGLNVSGGALSVGNGAGFNGYTYFHGPVYTTQQETGFMGAGGVGNGSTSGAIAGVGVNFKMNKNYTPSGITATELSSTTYPNWTNITPYGFWFYVNGDATINYRYWRGYYTC